jgi:hypothetical protein
MKYQGNLWSFIKIWCIYTQHSTTYNILVPLLQFENYLHKSASILSNQYSTLNKTYIFNQILNCSDNLSDGTSISNCLGVTSFNSLSADILHRPATNMYLPISL